MDDSTPTRGWLLLMHQLPTHPSHLRVKVWRRLASIGAVALKSSVYVLPRSDAALEDFQWVRSEILDNKGEATIVEAGFVDGVSDDEVEGLFRKARDVEYEEIAREGRALRKGASARLKEERRRELEAAVSKLERRLEEVVARDFFRAGKRAEATAAVRELRERLSIVPEAQPEKPARFDAASLRGRTWVTRTGVKIDRIASAWLIARFIDGQARFKLVAAKGYVPEAGELRFDMFDAEFSHRGEDCTFETLCRSFRLKRPGLRAVAEIVHDIDLKDDKFARAETRGVAAMIDGLTRLHRDDDTRIARGLELFDELLAHFAQEKSS